MNAVVTAARDGTDEPIGSYRGFAIHAGRLAMFSENPHLYLRGVGDTKVEMGVSASGNITRMENALVGLDDTIADCKREIEAARGQLADARRVVNEPFAHKDEIAALETRLATLNVQLGLDKPDEAIVGGDDMNVAAGREPIAVQSEEWEEAEIAEM